MLEWSIRHAWKAWLCEFTPRAAKAADNVGCEPPQIPLSKPLKQDAYWQTLAGTRFEPSLSSVAGRRSHDNSAYERWHARSAPIGSGGTQRNLYRDGEPPTRKSDWGSTHEIHRIRRLYFRRSLRWRITYCTDFLCDDILFKPDWGRDCNNGGERRFRVAVQGHVRRLGNSPDAAE
jgi:hypothetical protein